jgi:YD repeat-containing protein
MFSITNGFGSKTSISYKPLSNNDVYTKGVSSQYPIIVIQPALHVVYSITSDKELGEDLKTIYHYSGARIHKLGKGFLGFTSTTVKNYQNNIKTTTEFDIFVKNDKYFYPYAKSIKSWPIDMGSILIESTSNYPEVINTVANYDLIFMPIIEKSILHTRDMNGSFINTTKTFINKNDIDKYGNVKKTITLISPDNLHINDEDDKYAFKNTILSLFETPDLTHWLISRPSIIQQTKEYKEDSNNNDVLLKTFGYFNPGATGWPNLAWTQTIPNGNMALYTNIRYKYDNIYGNRIEETIAAPYANPPVEDRITTYDYNSDYNGRFLTRKTNTLNGINYVTEYDYYKDKGLLKSETFNPGHGSNSLTSKYEYDTFGKLNLIRSPDGILSKTSFKWVTNKPRVSFNMKSDFLFYKETYSIHEDVDDVPDNMVDLVYNAYDKFERETTIVSYDQNGNAIYSLKKYDEKSRLEEISDPHFYHDEYNSTNYKYDNLGRVITVDTPSESIKTDYNGRTTTVIASSTSVWKTKTVNAIGLTETISDPVGTISYKYSASGNVKSINALGATTSMLYDDAGNQTSLIDPNAGITTYVYNAYGELLSQTDAKKNNTKMYYDSFGRLAIKTLTNGETGVAETTKYTYQDEPNVGGFGQIKNISGSNKIEYGYTYDELSRLISKTETINGEVFTSNYTFHKLFNKIATFEYPSGFKIRYNYLSNGYIDKIIDFYNKSNFIYFSTK